MSNLILSFFCAFIVTFYAIPIIIKFAKSKNLYDFPGLRKIHKKRVPVLGGLAILLGVIFSVTLWITTHQFFGLIYIIGAATVIFLIGIRDDIVPLSARGKLLGQLIAAFILVNMGDIRLTSLYGIFGIDEIPIWLSYLVSLFTIIVIINSFNLIDGVDGLAGTIGAIVMLTFGIWFFMVSDMPHAVLAFGFLGALVAFLRYNFYPARIFMGDTGALLIGIVSAVLAIKFIEVHKQLAYTNDYKIKAAPALAFAILLIPLYDTLRVFILRTLLMKSPFSSDTNHIHHILMRMGVSHIYVVLLLGGLNIFFIIFAFVFQELGSFILITLMLLIAYILNVILNIVRFKKYPKKSFRGSLAARIFFF